MKYIFVTGGVVSGLGKGITAASLGRLLKARGFRVTMQKLDPYLNIDPGTMNPIQHGEVFVTEELPDLLWQKKVCTLNNTKYLLLEFDFGEPLFWCRKMLQNVTDMGYIPVIAHPERYDELQQAPWKVEEWLDMGCHIQVNKGSVLGRFGKSIARSADYLMKHNLVACVASDAHGCRQRTTDMRELQRYLTEIYSEEYARMVLWENPAKICRGQALY